MRVGIVTGGGDVAPLNAILYGAAVHLDDLGHELVGFREGWKGVLDPIMAYRLDPSNINPRAAGTILQSSRKKLKDAPIEDSIETAIQNIKKTVDGLIAIGGDDTLTVGKTISERLDIPVCLITKTIDNDVGRNAPEGAIDYGKIVNYFTPGFATAAYKAAIYVKELLSTTYDHKRIMFIETMGRTPGWLALSTFRADPDLILVPEVPLDIDHLLGKLEEVYARQGYTLVVVAEGLRAKGSDKPISQDEAYLDEHGHPKLGGVSEILAKKVKKDMGIENSNHIIPSYLYRSGICDSPEDLPRPLDLDRDSGIASGILAAQRVISNTGGTVIAMQRQGEKIVPVSLPLDDVLATDINGTVIPRNLDLRFYDPSAYAITPLGREYFRPISAK